MATQAIVRCDICPPEAATGLDAENAAFVYENVKYEIDLCAAHQVELLEAQESLLRFIEKARRTAAARRASAAPRQGRRLNEETTAVRKWAVANGIPVADRGRIPKDVVDGYHEAQAAQSAARAVAEVPPVPAPDLTTPPIVQFAGV